MKSLKWEYIWYRECHIRPDLLLIYRIYNDKLILSLLRVWSHSELF
jgi:mRNA interferase YafQ